MAGAEAVLGGPERAAEDVERQLRTAAVLQCAEMAGVIGRVLEFTIEYAFDRYSFGRPLASYQALKHRFADMKLWVEASYATADAAAHAVDADSPSAAELVSVAKAYIGERAPAIIQDCVQLHGGIGTTWDHDIHLYLRRVIVDQVTAGHAERPPGTSGRHHGDVGGRRRWPPTSVRSPPKRDPPKTSRRTASGRGTGCPPTCRPCRME